jgi:hypothetical protein
LGQSGVALTLCFNIFVALGAGKLERPQFEPDTVALNKD